MKKRCEQCKRNISGRAIIYDDYYFCSSECRGAHINASEEDKKLQHQLNVDAFKKLSEDAEREAYNKENGTR